MASSDEKTATSSLREAEAKWAAIVDDRLVPMPRRQLRVRDILHQAGATPGVVLVRDYNSPNDVGLESEAMVDLAQGNVFRTSSDCVQTSEFQCAAPPKLAFVVDDRWEVTIQPRQTGATLRGLLDVSEGVDLIRDYQSPRDESIEEHEAANFTDGPVFITRSAESKEYTIIVNGRRKVVNKPKLSFGEIVALAYDPVPTGPNIYFTVTYQHGHPANPEGSLTAGRTVKIKNGMVFNVTVTDKS